MTALIVSPYTTGGNVITDMRIMSIRQVHREKPELAANFVPQLRQFAKSHLFGHESLCPNQRTGH